MYEFKRVFVMWQWKYLSVIRRMARYLMPSIKVSLSLTGTCCMVCL